MSFVSSRVVDLNKVQAYYDKVEKKLVENIKREEECDPSQAMSDRAQIVANDWIVETIKGYFDIDLITEIDLLYEMIPELRMIYAKYYEAPTKCKEGRVLWSKYYYLKDFLNRVIMGDFAYVEEQSVQVDSKVPAT